jgi:uncharacterized protein (UPF0179 family)
MNKIIILSIFLILTSCSQGMKTAKLTEIVINKYHINTNLWKINNLLIKREKTLNKTDLESYDISFDIILQEDCYNIQTGDNYFVNYLRKEVSDYRIYENDVCLTENEIATLYNQEIDKKRQMIGDIVCQDSMAKKIYNKIFKVEECSIKMIYGEKEFLEDKVELLNDMILKKKYLDRIKKGKIERIKTNIKIRYDKEKDDWVEVI